MCVVWGDVIASRLVPTVIWVRRESNVGVASVPLIHTILLKTKQALG
ncbi:hypothetical protein ACVWYU_004184 [Pseudomonas sp. TE12234]